MRPFKKRIDFDDGNGLGGTVIVTKIKAMDGEEMFRVDIHADRTNIELSNFTGKTSQTGIPFEDQMLAIAVRKKKQ